jgi:hypothetical protein
MSAKALLQKDECLFQVGSGVWDEGGGVAVGRCAE